MKPWHRKLSGMAYIYELAAVLESSLNKNKTRKRIKY
jgi:hypothetical protein